VRRAGFAVLILLAVAGCGGGSASVSPDNLGRLVLQPADLGKSFTSFGNGPQIALDNNGTPRADAARFGREGGWIARYRRGGTKRTEGPLIVESRVDVFKSGEGAKSDLAAYRAMFASEPGAAAHAVAAPKVGDAALATTFEQAGALPVTYYRVAWRFRNATASVTVEGWRGRIRPTDAYALARKQQVRLARG
jgi:hypothetical protein